MAATPPNKPQGKRNAGRLVQSAWGARLAFAQDEPAEAANGRDKRTNAATNRGKRRFSLAMPIVEFTPMSAHALWSDVIGWLLDRFAFRVDKRLPEPINGLIRKLN